MESDMDIREKIQRKCERIAASIANYGRSEGTEIATQEEMYWLALQMALRGVLFSYSADESTYQNGDESYYYYWAISASEDRDKVDGFLRYYPVLSASKLNKLYILTDDSQQHENVKLVRRHVMRHDRQRRQRKKKERLEQEAWEREQRENEEREQRENEEREAAMQEAYDHRDDLVWLVSRIESLGWEVTLKRKTNTNHTN